MRRLLLYLPLLFGILLSQSTWAQHDDIEETDSTSTGWGGGGGGGLNPELPTGSVTSISLSRTSVTLDGGKFIKLVATINSDAQNKSVIWTTSNSSIASVDNYGLVRALGKGKATITATAAGNTELKAVCNVTVTSDYNGMRVPPDVSFEFCYNAADYDALHHTIPNHPLSNMKDASLQLSENIPALVNGELLRIAERCEGYIDRWDKGSTESGAYFFRQGSDCMTIVAKVAPKLNTGNASDFVCNRGDGYNYMWRIGDNNRSYLHTWTAYDENRSLLLSTEKPQILAVRVDGNNNVIILQNLTTGERRQIENVNWGGGNNVFKLFYNDGGEFFLGDFYWVYYSFELLTDGQINLFKESILKGDVNDDGDVDIADAVCIVNHVVGKSTLVFNAAAADVNGDGDVDIADAVRIVNLVVGKIDALARRRQTSLPESE